MWVGGIWFGKELSHRNEHLVSFCTLITFFICLRRCRRHIYFQRFWATMPRLGSTHYLLLVRSPIFSELFNVAIRILLVFFPLKSIPIFNRFHVSAISRCRLLFLCCNGGWGYKWKSEMGHESTMQQRVKRLCDSNSIATVYTSLLSAYLPHGGIGYAESKDGFVRPGHHDRSASFCD